MDPDQQKCKEIEKGLRQLLSLKPDPQEGSAPTRGVSSPRKSHNHDRNRSESSGESSTCRDSRQRRDNPSKHSGKPTGDNFGPRGKGPGTPRKNSVGEHPRRPTDGRKPSDEGAACSYPKSGESSRTKKAQWVSHAKVMDDELQDANLTHEHSRTESLTEYSDDESAKRDKKKRKRKKKQREKKFSPLNDVIEVKMNCAESRMNNVVNYRPQNVPSRTEVVPHHVHVLNRESVPLRHNDTHQIPIDRCNRVKPKSSEESSDILEDNKCSPQELARLEQDYIFPLKKKMTKHPRALFFCRLCDYHCDNIQVCNKHIRDSRHQKNKANKELDMTLNNIPNPTRYQTDHITGLLKRVEKQKTLTEAEITKRKELVAKLNGIVTEKLTNCELYIYGSTMSKFGLKTSDLNVDLVIRDKENPSKMLLAVFELLKEKCKDKVESDFTAKIPSIFYTEKDTGLRCVISLNNSLAQKTAALLGAYVDMDPRVKTLAVAFRYWAKLCMIDDQVRGTLPAYSYALMLVYFLQQHPQPVLPVLHETPGGCENNVEKFKQTAKKWKITNTKSIGQLWVELFKFYSVKLKLTDIVISIRQKKAVSRGEKNWGNKRIAIEDPFSPKRNIASSISNVVLFDYIFERFKMTYKYFGIPRTKEGPLFDKLLTITKYDVDCEYSADINRSLFMKALDTLSSQHKVDECRKLEPEKPAQREADESSSSLGDSKESDTDKNAQRDDVISEPKDSSTKPDQKMEKNEINANKKQEIEGKMDTDESSKEKPYPLENFFSGLDGSQDELDSEHSESTPCCGEDDSEQENCIPMSLMEALDDGAEASSLSGTEGGTDACHSPRKKVEQTEKLQIVETKTQALQDSADENRLAGESDNKKLEGNAVDETAKNVQESAKEKESSVESSVAKEMLNDEKKRLPYELRKKLELISRDDFYYEFLQSLFTNGKSPAVICALCQKEGHLKQSCPDEILPALEPLYQMSEKFRSALDETCNAIFRDHAPSDLKIKERELILTNLQEFIRQTYEGAKLELFGSSCNGFGFYNSDLDICLTFEDEKMVGKEGCVERIENLSKKLKKHKSLYNVVAITTAKVPIVKFTHRPTKLEGDISLYNTLAQHNTRMLRLYSHLDQRVQVLGYTMKYFAKICDIGDASRGSLSSYAYILMVIYFLQQRQPPVIPVLQEFYESGKTPPMLMVDGWNAWFCEDDNLKSKWSHHGKNKETVGELWLGLLRFYTEEFKFQEYVISIRQLKPLTRFEKLWNSKCIAIEDPFDLDHNLGAGVSRKMNSYIMKALIRGRNIFGRPPEFVDYNCYLLQRCLFNAERLTEGIAPPNDRGCRVCGKIGHMMKDCPRRLKGKENVRDSEMGRDQHLSRNLRKENHMMDVGIRPGHHDHHHPRFYPPVQHVKGGPMPPISHVYQPGIYPRPMPSNVRPPNMRMNGPIHPLGNFAHLDERGFQPSRFVDSGNIRSPIPSNVSHPLFGNNQNENNFGKGKPIRTMIVANKSMAELEARESHHSSNPPFQSMSSNKSHQRLSSSASQHGNVPSGTSGNFKKVSSLDKVHPHVKMDGSESSERTGSSIQLSASASAPSLPLSTGVDNKIAPLHNDIKHVRSMLQGHMMETRMPNPSSSSTNNFEGHSLIGVDGNLASSSGSQVKMPVNLLGNPGILPMQRPDTKMMPMSSQMLLMNQVPPPSMTSLPPGMHLLQQQQMPMSHQGSESEQSSDYMMPPHKQMSMFAKYPSATSCNTVIALPSQATAPFANRPTTPFSQSQQFAGYQVRHVSPNGYPLYHMMPTSSQMTGLGMPPPPQIYPQSNLMQPQQQHLQHQQLQKKMQTPPPPPPSQNAGKFPVTGNNPGAGRTYAQAASQIQPSSKNSVPGFQLGVSLHDIVSDRPFDAKHSVPRPSQDHPPPFWHSAHIAENFNVQSAAMTPTVQTHTMSPLGKAMANRLNPEGD